MITCRFQLGKEVTDKPKFIVEFDEVLPIDQIKRIAAAMEKAATEELNCMTNCSNPNCEKAHGQPSNGSASSFQ